MKATAVAHSNIALIKYWGKLDKRLRLPMNNSISMALSDLKTKTTVEFSTGYSKDGIVIDGKKMEGRGKERIIKHLDRIRNLANVNLCAKVVSKNNFPADAGLASSASGFAALTLAGTRAVGLDLSKKELSILARLGSGSACRSIHGGFVEWKMGSSHKNSYAEQLAPADYFDLRDIVAIVGKEKKEVSSTAGHARVETSPFYQARLAALHKDLSDVRTGIKEKDIEKLGNAVERDCISMHTTMMTSEPAIFYWSPKTLEIIHKVQECREEGLKAYFTIDAGPNVHILTLPQNIKEIREMLKEIGVEDIIYNKPAGGFRITKNHLF